MYDLLIDEKKSILNAKNKNKLVKVRQKFSFKLFLYLQESPSFH